MRKTITLDGKKYTGKALVAHLLAKGARRNEYGYLVWRDDVIIIPWRWDVGQRGHVGCGLDVADCLDIDECGLGVRSVEVCK